MRDDIDRVVKGLERHIGKHEIAALTDVGSLADLLKKNFSEGIMHVREIYDKALDYAYTDEKGVNHRGYVQAMCGGPYEAVPVAICNAIGELYPNLTREQKDQGLRAALDLMDGQNYVVVQDVYTVNVREPLLLADIYVARYLYWPGMDEGKSLISKFPGFFEFQNEMIGEDGLFRQDRVRSDFIVAYSLLRSDVVTPPADVSPDSSESSKRSISSVTSVPAAPPEAVLILTPL
jgi:hypothetical protein